jgi:hypothetical protein
MRSFTTWGGGEGPESAEELEAEFPDFPNQDTV